MDIDYLIDTVLKILEPFSEQAFSYSETRVYVPLVNKRTKHLEYINNQQNYPPLEILRAAKALPFIYGEPVTLGKIEYIDGATVATLKNMISKATELGATHILVFDNQVENNFYKLIKRLLMFRMRIIDLPTEKLVTNNVINIKGGGKTSNFLTRNPEKLALLFDQGYDAVKNHPTLREFLAD